MEHTAYGFIEKDMYDEEDCAIEVYKTKDEAIKEMKRTVEREVYMFARDFGYSPVVYENLENDQITVINCSKEEYDLLLGSFGEVPRTDYRVVEVYMDF